MKIAVLAWGSIIWARRALEVTTDFKPEGPMLPIEFCRVSSDGRLKLVVDEMHGFACTTYHARSAFDDLVLAIKNLSVREGMRSTANVGFVNQVTGDCSKPAFKRYPKVIDKIRKWAVAGGYDGAVWTALGTNFADPGKANEPFSVEAAIRYLGRRDKVCFARSLHYIWSAPPEIQTPVRDAVNLHWPE
jgi:hypothetical protein